MGTVDPVAVAASGLLPGVPEPAGQPVQIRLSHYKPWLGGVNCARFMAGQCVSRMASGERWQNWINRAAACPREWPFGTLLILPGDEVFVCLDRGGKIVIGPDGVAWVDLLLASAPPVPFGTVVEATVIFP
jgi:hypothetical protein